MSYIKKEALLRHLNALELTLNSVIGSYDPSYEASIPIKDLKSLLNEDFLNESDEEKSA